MSRTGSPSTLAHRQYDSGESTPSYPLLPSHLNRMYSEDKHQKREDSYQKREDSLDRDPKREDSYPDSDPRRSYPGMHQRTETGDSFRPDNRRSSSWDILGGMRRLEHSYVEFDPRRASHANLAYAEGDMPKNTVSALSLFYNACRRRPRTAPQSLTRSSGGMVLTAGTLVCPPVTSDGQHLH